MRDVVSEVSLAIAPGEAVGLVGESGSGKSMTARAVIRVLPPTARVSGEITFDGAPVLSMASKQLRAFRQKDVAMIFQDPSVHLNPIRTILDFLAEGMRLRGVTGDAARSRAKSLLSQVLIDDPDRVLDSYPHQLSGGMLQRVMIASAIDGEPRLLLADEPTTALDVTTQAEVLAIIDRLRRERGVGLLFITHDLELAAAICDRTVVMYAGRTVEEQGSMAVHRAPLHPYTAGLLVSRPHVSQKQARLQVLPGRPIAAYEAPGGCSFAPRCAHAQPACEAEVPAFRALAGGHVACRRAEELRTAGLLKEVTHAES
ncbi:MAG: ABC transporter ATP-binding protein [Actinobacteria bacterium]|nr:ABC transporter ATP-binding protein [Actinomycetota bacterium]